MGRAQEAGTVSSDGPGRGTAEKATDKLKVEVVGKHGPLWSGRAHYVSIPAADGRLGILSGRQPVLAVLTPGDVEIRSGEGQDVVVKIESGFASVDADFVTVVVEGGVLAAGN